MSETNVYSENLLDCNVRRSIVHSLPAKISPNPQIIFSTSVASMLPTTAGVAFASFPLHWDRGHDSSFSSLRN